MPFRATIQKLIRRDATSPSLRERAAELRGSLAGQTRRTVVAGSVAAAVPLPVIAASAPQERAEHRARLLAAYEEDRLARPIAGRAEGGDLEEHAAHLVTRRLWRMAREVLALPAPGTVDGLAVTALAAMVLIESDYSDDDPTATAAVSLTRAIFALTGTPYPAGFVGFGDEPDHKERDCAIHAAAGSLPAWAIAQAQANHERDCAIHAAAGSLPAWAIAQAQANHEDDA